MIAKALWSGLDDGTISIIGSDHAPYTDAEKQAAWEDIRQAPPGIPSIDIFYSLVLHLALSGYFSIGRAVALASTNPAKMYHLHPQKGDFAGWLGCRPCAIRSTSNNGC